MEVPALPLINTAGWEPSKSVSSVRVPGSAESHQVLQGQNTSFCLDSGNRAGLNSFQTVNHGLRAFEELLEKN